MSNAVFNLPRTYNEPVLSYVKGSPERIKLVAALKELKAKKVDIPMYIGGKEVFTTEKVDIHPPHELKHKLGTYNKGGSQHVKQAIQAALKAKPAWESMDWQDRAGQCWTNQQTHWK